MHTRESSYTPISADKILNTLIEVKVGIDVMEVILVSVVEIKIKMKYNLLIEGLDPRITFYNLKENNTLNGLVQ